MNKMRKILLIIGIIVILGGGCILFSDRHSTYVAKPTISLLNIGGKEDGTKNVKTIRYRVHICPMPFAKETDDMWLGNRQK